MERRDEKDKKEIDPFKSLKYMGYCMAALPPEDIEFHDFIKYAKFHLCMQNKVLMKDPTWENYTDEEILIEYFASIYYNNSDAKNEFAAEIGDVDNDILDWFHKMAEKNKSELENKIKDLDENIKFNPGELDE